MKLKLTVHHPVPSLNRLFNLNHWGRFQERKATQDAFLSALYPFAGRSSTPTTSVPSTLSIAYGTLVCYVATRSDRRKLPRIRRKSLLNQWNGQR